MELIQRISFATDKILSCREDVDDITWKRCQGALSSKPWVVNLHLLFISWAGLSAVVSQFWLSVRAEDVSPVSSSPIWFPLTNVTAVPPATEQITAQCVCVWDSVCVCVWYSVSQVVLYSTKKCVYCTCSCTRFYVCVCLCVSVCCVCTYTTQWPLYLCLYNDGHVIIHVC